MTAVINPPSFQPRRRSRWGSSGSQSALSALNGDEVARMLMQRENIPRSNSLPSIASSSLSSSTATIIQSNLPATGALMSAATDPGLLAFPTVRKRTQKTIQRFKEKSDMVSSLKTARNRYPSAVVKTESNSQSSTDISQTHQQASNLPSHKNVSQSNSQQANGTRSSNHLANDGNPILYLISTNGTFDRKAISIPFYPDCVRIGRQTNAKTMPTSSNGYFDSKVLSRQHAEIWADQDAKIWIRDVKSSNGTFVNGKRLSPENQDSEPHELQTTDQLELGIDIISEDQKTIVHRKVAARVEYAGMPGSPVAFSEMEYGDLEQANSALVVSPQALLHSRGRVDSLPSNNRFGALASFTAQQMSMSQQRQVNFWLTPITMEQIVKKLTHEIRIARQQTNDLGRAHNFLGSLLSNDPTKEADKPFVGVPTSVAATNSSFRPELKSRFSDPPAPPPQQPLPEKPNYARSIPQPAPAIKRSITERPRSISRVTTLVEALASAKKVIDQQNARLKDLEAAVIRERQARELAEETAKNLVMQCDVKSTENLDFADQRSVAREEVFEPSTNSTEYIMKETKEELPNTLPVDSRANNETTLMLEKRLESTLKDMEELRCQMENYKQRAEIAECNRNSDRRTLAELVEKIRLSEVSKKLPSNEESLPCDNKMAITDSKERNKFEKGNADYEFFAAVPVSKDEIPLSSAHSPLVMEVAGVIKVLAKTSNGCDKIYQTAPYASIIGVVLIGVGIMAYLNGWLSKVEQ